MDSKAAVSKSLLSPLMGVARAGDIHLVPEELILRHLPGDVSPPEEANRDDNPDDDRCRNPPASRFGSASRPLRLGRPRGCAAPEAVPGATSRAAPGSQTQSVVAKATESVSLIVAKSKTHMMNETRPAHSCVPRNHSNVLPMKARSDTLRIASATRRSCQIVPNRRCRLI
jgi:hypothetical protein